jgi:hypothetical protein
MKYQQVVELETGHRETIGIPMKSKREMERQVWFSNQSPSIPGAVYSYLPVDMVKVWLLGGTMPPLIGSIKNYD